MIVTTLFFMWGFISCMNDLLIPKFKADFSLTRFQANLVQFAFFGAYFLVSLAYFLISAAKGDPINKIGYKNHPKAGKVYAFEVDAFGNSYCTDDGNIPNLLSLPYLGAVKSDDEIYQNTRKRCFPPTIFIGASAKPRTISADRTSAWT